MGLALPTGASTAVAVDAASAQISNEYAMWHFTTHSFSRGLHGSLQTI